MGFSIDDPYSYENVICKVKFGMLHACRFIKELEA